ncbi:hypothetical protein C1645_512145 [Glomus cerebriforme]|uniref:Uncharacterized protein n=1 Tax=Glomus cerebriforme TaxID=658196 RepID=A0A397TF44_9GLOM|nr:hypothetical protein C1645_512145 [Glomus cerebriforme]
MDLTNTNENYFDPTPKLKSSPIPINFISFNINDEYCFYCKEEYTRTQKFDQKYCKNCFSQYVNNIDDNNTYLDVIMTTLWSGLCQEHANIRNEMFTTCNIKERCKNCSYISRFNQILAYHGHYSYYSYQYTPTENCTLCGKNIYQTILDEFRLCSDCYLISSGWINSLNEKRIPVLYLPYWNNCDKCLVCDIYLGFISDCQKLCTRCHIVYSGCRYCLTTNIIFGLLNQTQCRKCRRILEVIIHVLIIIQQ